MTENLLGWHFIRAGRRLSYGDGRLVEVGQTLTVEGPLEICRCGLHYCERARDALRYAPGLTVCRVRASGDILRGGGENADKACASERTALAIADTTRVVVGWAAWCAQQALDARRAAGGVVDERSHRAVTLAQQWADGEAVSIADLHAARDAADAAYATDAAAYAAGADAAERAARITPTNAKSPRPPNGSRGLLCGRR